MSKQPFLAKQIREKLEAEGRLPPSPQPDLAAPGPQGWQGDLAKKPWDYQVTAVVPHCCTPDFLNLCIECLRAQTIRPFIVVVDTCSKCPCPIEPAADLEVHRIQTHGVEHPADLVSMAMDAGQALCRSEWMLAVHSDCFVIRPDLIEDWIKLASQQGPYRFPVGYEMLPRDGDLWRGKFSHTLTLLHVPTLDQLGATWSTRRVRSVLGATWDAQTRRVMADPETGPNLLFESARIHPLIQGSDSTPRDGNRVHLGGSSAAALQGRRSPEAEKLLGQVREYLGNNELQIDGHEEWEPRKTRADIHVVGLMALYDHPRWKECLASLAKLCNHVICRIDPDCKHNLKEFDWKNYQVFHGKAPWNAWSWRQEFADNFNLDHWDVVLFPDEDEEFGPGIEDAIVEFANRPETVAVFGYEAPMPMKKPPGIAMFDGKDGVKTVPRSDFPIGGKPYPLCPHAKMFKWSPDLTYENYRGFAWPSNYVGEAPYRPAVKIKHFALWTPELLARKRQQAKQRGYPAHWLDDNPYPRHAVYTAVFGGKDRLLPQPLMAEGVEFVAFCDEPPAESNGWKIVVGESPAESDDPLRQAKWFKVNSHICMRLCEYTVWIDANMVLKVHPIELIERWSARKPVTLCRHPERHAIEEEIDVCIRFRRDDPDVMRQQLKRYSGLPQSEMIPLCAGGFIVRKTSDVAAFERMWWNEICEYSRRDQLSLPVALWWTKTDATVLEWDGEPNKWTQFFELHKHAKGDVVKA